MSLRELVTGSDACTPSDGSAGPSNALSSFTNAFVGSGSKTQEQLREVCAVRCSRKLLLVPLLGHTLGKNHNMRRCSPDGAKYVRNMLAGLALCQ